MRCWGTMAITGSAWKKAVPLSSPTEGHCREFYVSKFFFALFLFRYHWQANRKEVSSSPHSTIEWNKLPGQIINFFCLEQQDYLLLIGIAVAGLCVVIIIIVVSCVLYRQGKCTGELLPRYFSCVCQADCTAYKYKQILICRIFNCVARSTPPLQHSLLQTVVTM